MSKIAVLGDRDSVLGFRALGLEVLFAEDRDRAAKELQIQCFVFDENTVPSILCQTHFGMNPDSVSIGILLYVVKSECGHVTFHNIFVILNN